MATGGAFIPALPGLALTGAGVIRVFETQSANFAGSSADVGPFRPPQWARPAVTSITVPAPYVQTPAAAPATQPVAGGSSFDPTPSGAVFTMSVGAAQPTPPNAAPVTYVFDAIMRIGHSQQARPTRNPIQVGANMADHVLLEPPRVILDVAMSDAMDSFTPGQWTGNTSKSVAAFQVLDNLRASRIPLTVTTRLKTYTNMIITDIPVEDTYRTAYGLRTPVIFEGIFVAQVGNLSVSARPQTTGPSTAIGTVQPTPPDAGSIAHNMLPSTTTGVQSSSALQQQLGTVPGAGAWSSNNTSDLTRPES